VTSSQLGVVLPSEARAFLLTIQARKQKELRTKLIWKLKHTHGKKFKNP
jgi:hypothetical protein